MIRQWIPPLLLTPASPEAFGGVSALMSYTGSGATTEDTAYFVPYRLAGPMRIRKLFCVNGASVNGSVDLGIYDYSGKRLASSTPTTQAGTNAPQYFDITDTDVGPGVIYLAMLSDSATGTFFRWSLSAGSSNPLALVHGILEQAGISTLPDPVTFARLTATGNTIPFFGAISGRAL